MQDSSVVQVVDSTNNFAEDQAGFLFAKAATFSADQLAYVTAVAVIEKDVEGLISFIVLSQANHAIALNQVKILNLCFNEFLAFGGESCTIDDFAD